MNPYHFGHYNHNHGGYPYNHHHVHPHDHWFHDPLWPVMIYPGHDHPPYIDCMDHHVALFSTVGRGLTGEKGEKGDQGDQGIQGPEGPQGQDGPAGYGFHSHWDGTKLVIENEDGTEQDPVDLKGSAGDPGISVTHEWDGTTLIVNSASGTSSADLKGDTGEFDDLTESQLDDMVAYIGQRIDSSAMKRAGFTFVSALKNNQLKWRCVDSTVEDAFDMWCDIEKIPLVTEYEDGLVQLLYGENASSIDHADFKIEMYINGLYLDNNDNYDAGTYNRDFEREAGITVGADPKLCDWHLYPSGNNLYAKFEYPQTTEGEILKIVFCDIFWPEGQ